MDKEVVVHIHNGYYSAIKRNAFESVLIKWVKLEPSFRKRVRKRKINIIF